MVNERSDSQFAGLVNSWTGRFIRGFVKSGNAVFKIALYQLSNANFPLHCKWIFSLSLFGPRSCRICWLSVIRQQIRPNRAWTALLCWIYCCLVLFSLFIFTIYFFRNGKRLRKDQNHVGMGVLLTRSNEYHIRVLTRTVHAASESKLKIKVSLENILLENAHF